MKQLCIKRRKVNYDGFLNLGQVGLNGGYTLSFRYNGSRDWYVKNNVVKVLDTIIDGKYLDEDINGNPRKDKLFGMIEFDETKISIEDLTFDITNDYKDYAVRALTNQEAIEFLKSFTTCQEIEPNKFILVEGYTDIQGQTIEPYILDLN